MEITEETQLHVAEKKNDVVKKPLLSVVMLVYNAEKYLAEAIDSVLNQTFRDFEFIIINDGSTDRSQEIISTYKDKRIRLINNPNRGIPYSRNLGLKEARGEFLAWFDSDDIILPKRFEKQIRFLQANEQFGVCGTWLHRFNGTKNYTAKVSKDPEIIKAKLLFKTSVLNATAMYRLSMIKKAGVKFNNDLPISEDYDFYLQCSKHFPLTNLQEVLYRYRASETSIVKQFETQEDKNYNIHKVVYKQALNDIGLQPSEAEFKIHSMVASEKLFDSFEDFQACFDWLVIIHKKNQQTKTYDLKALDRVLAEEFLYISKRASKFGWKTLRFYLANHSNFALPGLVDVSKLILKCAIKYNKF